MLINANAINNVGQITGYGTKKGHNRGFLLTPQEMKAGAGQGVMLPQELTQAILGLRLTNFPEVRFWIASGWPTSRPESMHSRQRSLREYNGAH